MTDAPLPDSSPPLRKRFRRILFGPPRDLADRSLLHRIALVPLLAWVGLGADGLSSSSYGPDEAFRTLFTATGDHTYLAIGLAALTAATVFIISAGYSRIIELFPEGGGGYVVATSLLGRPAGVVSGCALLVDYVLTITVSIAAAGAALFSLLPLGWEGLRLPLEVGAILGLILLNIRGVRESVITLAPIFILFAVTHIIAILGGFFGHIGQMPETAAHATNGFQTGLQTLGLGGMVLLFLHAYSLGGGTYTGIEAVSNGLMIMREPRVHTARRTMMYMAVSLAFTAGGLLVLYLLWQVRPLPGQTMNAVLLNKLVAGFPPGLGYTFVLLTLLSEGALLIVAAQTGFLDGPRVLANMAIDSWMPHRFAAFSERLTTQNGILLMGVASLAALLYAHGDVRTLVVLYAINVFVTFSLSMLGMLLWSLRKHAGHQRSIGGIILFAVALLLCATVLVITTVEKFADGAWLTVVVTGGLVAMCFWIRGHYRMVAFKLTQLYAELENLPKFATKQPGEFDPQAPTAAILVASYGGLGIHTFMNVFRAFPGHFKNLVFLSVGVIDPSKLKSDHAVEDLKERTRQTLEKYVELARGLGVPATLRFSVSTDVVEESEKLCLEICREFPRTTFFAGKVIFKRESWYQRLLHNETAFAVQKRLHWAGRTMVILPARVR